MREEARQVALDRRQPGKKVPTCGNRSVSRMDGTLLLGSAWATLCV
jgi:hypothetical protein